MLDNLDRCIRAADKKMLNLTLSRGVFFCIVQVNSNLTFFNGRYY